jgi:hypothetical protein
VAIEWQDFSKHFQIIESSDTGRGKKINMLLSTLGFTTDQRAFEGTKNIIENFPMISYIKM